MRFQGKRLTVSVFGQSHAAAIGAVIDGLPAGVRIDREALQAFLDRRAPGQGAYATARKEADAPEFISGLVEDRTCGTPVCAVIRNGDTRSGDYEAFRRIPRPSHSDWPATVKYGDSHDLRGGGAFSGRLTAPLCVAGGIALQMLAERGVRVGAHIASVGDVSDAAFDPVNVSAADFDRIRENGFPTLCPEAGQEMLREIEEARQEADSIGGTVECAAIGLPAGLGGPLFEGLESALAGALFAIPAVRGVEFGRGFAATGMRGSEHNDAYVLREGRIRTETNHAGGIVGGISTGMPVLIRIAFKPTPSIGKPQRTLNLETGEETELIIRGRHDPCVVPRAVPVAEAVTALTLLDELLSGAGT